MVTRYFDANSNEDSTVYTSITESEWQLAAELEGILHTVAAFNLGEVQKQTVSASYSILLLNKATAVVRSKSILCCTRGRPKSTTTASSMARTAIDINVMGKLGRKCLVRLGH